MHMKPDYPIALNEAIERLKVSDQFALNLIRIGGEPEDGYLEIAMTKEQRVLDNWAGVFAADSDPRYHPSSMTEVIDSFEALRFDARAVLSLDEFKVLTGDIKVLRFADADNQFIANGNGMTILFHITTDWETLRETMGHHVSLSVN